MDKTLTNNSGILLVKSKFFLYRVLTYFSFLLFPIWVPKSLELNSLSLCFLMTLYIMFMCSQWFLLGKEIDHRLKIYFKVNSSFDRIVYRLFLGMIIISIIFNVINLLPSKWIYNSFWIVWILLGLFYSWPTRGKIIQESVSSNFNEFNYLDRFEKTLLFLIIFYFLISIPELPIVQDESSLRLFFDPSSIYSDYYWNFIRVMYYPFKSYPKLFTVAWSMHFYIVGSGLFLFVTYALSRFFLSRRLSLLTVFAILSSWSFSKILANNFGDAISTTYTILWIWSTMWVAKSSTYRSGLFLGLIGFLGTVINPFFSLFSFVQLIALHGYFLKEKTNWFRRQILKYYIFGFLLMIYALASTLTTKWNIEFIDTTYLLLFKRILTRKAIYILSFFGFIIYFLKYFFPNFSLVKTLNTKRKTLEQLGFSILCIFMFSLVSTSVNKSFTLMWMFALLSLVPVELIFQSISRDRSKRNVIFVAYILVCILDSHFEGRIKIFLRLFNS